MKIDDNRQKMLFWVGKCILLMIHLKGQRRVILVRFKPIQSEMCYVDRKILKNSLSMLIAFCQKILIKHHMQSQLNECAFISLSTF